MKQLHDQDRLFRDALAFTAVETGFPDRLIEKDYFCTLALAHLSRQVEALAFKGGTCLAKVHAGFYRLSEDLDFGISTQTSATRSERGKLVAGVKEAVGGIRAAVPALAVRSPLTGAASSTQYLAELVYVSLLDGHEEPIKIEVGLREPFLEPIIRRSAHTMLLDPARGEEAVKPVAVHCISWLEAMAEKFRAATTRREPAIRDFYDLDHAVRAKRLDPREQLFLALVRKKLAIPGNGPADLSRERIASLRGQVDSVLGPVLRPDDFAAFDLDRSMTLVRNIAAAL